MLKVVLPHAFNLGVPVARIVDLHSRGVDRGWMQKRAAVLTKEIAAVRPEKGHTFIHAISLGSMEAYGANRNGDGFNEKSARYEAFDPKPGGPKSLMLDGGLMQFHQTFTKYAKVYKDHVNKDPALASGMIVAEAYNPDMRRGELLIKVQNDKWAPELEKMANGEDPPFSMSCKVPYDICSACLNKAPSRAQYCDHLKDEMGTVKEAGHQIFAINDRPCYFDYSGVFRPADRIAFGLQKVASTGEMPQEFIPSTMLAEMWGLKVPNSVLYDSSPRPVQEKLAAMERLAAMEKQIEARGQLFNPEVDQGVASGSLPEDELDKLRSVDWNELMGALAQAQVCLPMKDFFRLMLGNKYDSVAGEMGSAQSLLPGIFSRMLNSGDGVEDVTGTTAYDPATSLMPKSVRDVIESVKPSMSLAEGPVGRRLSITIIRGGSPDGMRKLSADLRASKTAQYMAKQYAAYQLAFSRAQEGAGDGLATGLALLQNYTA
jgi:hypothetical protein